MNGGAAAAPPPPPPEPMLDPGLPENVYITCDTRPPFALLFKGSLHRKCILSLLVPFEGFPPICKCYVLTCVCLCHLGTKTNIHGKSRPSTKQTTQRMVRLFTGFLVQIDTTVQVNITISTYHRSFCQGEIEEEQILYSALFHYVAGLTGQTDWIQFCPR